MGTMAILPDHTTRTNRPAARNARQQRTDSITSHLASTDPQSADFNNLRHQLIEANLEVASSIARRFSHRGLDLDDLEQVALLGLTKAAQRFDATAGHDFLSFAVPTIRGELRRHFRDCGWTIRPPRRIQELQARIARAQEELEQILHRSPRPTEVAQHLNVDPDTVVEALAADGYFRPTSLDAPVAENATIAETLGVEDAAVRAMEVKLVLQPLLAGLPARERRILHLRFYEDCTQQQIAEEVGVTQTQVSRILARTLSRLRSRLADHTPAA